MPAPASLDRIRRLVASIPHHKQRVFFLRQVDRHIRLNQPPSALTRIEGQILDRWGPYLHQRLQHSPSSSWKFDAFDPALLLDPASSPSIASLHHTVARLRNVSLPFPGR